VQVRDVMTRRVECVLPRSHLLEAALEMESAGVGALPVIDDGFPVGVVTDRDLVVRALIDSHDLATTTVEQVMTREPISCAERDDVARAARLMGEAGVRRLLVRGADGRLSGLLSLGDLARHDGADAAAGEALRGVCRHD